MSIVEYFMGTAQEKKILRQRDSLNSGEATPKVAQKRAPIESQAQTISRKLFLRRAVAAGSIAAVSAIPVVGSLLRAGNFEPQAAPRIENQPKSFKDRVLSFSWDQAEGSKLGVFVDDLASEYLRLTRTDLVDKTDLIVSITYFARSQEMVTAIKSLNPSYPVRDTLYAYANQSSRKIFISLSTLREQVSNAARQQNQDPNKTAGLALLDAFWHEFGHLDTKERTEGELLNNPKYYFFSPRSQLDEVFRKYIGMQVLTDTYFGFLWFDEVVNETVTVRRMLEQVGLSGIVSAADYYPNGVDFFPQFTSVAGIDLNTLYQIHATSDFEGLLKLMGSKLPGGQTPMEKGMNLAVAIHRSNPQLIRQTGVYNLLPNKP